VIAVMRRDAKKSSMKIIAKPPDTYLITLFIL